MTRKTIAVIAAHPDDEILGCGATIAKHIVHGDQVHVLIMSEGLTSRDFERDEQKHCGALSELKKIALSANEIVGSTSVEFLSLPDNRMDSMLLLDIIKRIETFIQRKQPSVIYTHYGSDVNIDHQKVHEAVITATRPVPGQSVSTVLCFEVASSTEWQPATSKTSFSPNWFSDIGGEYFDKKLKALEVYQCEMRPWPHARSLRAIEHLAGWRGASVGFIAAEAFMLMRNLVRN